MTTIGRITIFGAVSGLVWTLVLVVLMPGLIQSSGEAIEVFACGITSGVIVSLLLSYPLRRVGSNWSLAFGVGALPLGAFFFGLLRSILQPSSGYVINAGQMVEYHDSAIGMGFGMAVLSVFSIFTPLFLPLAILTTYLLRLVMLRSPKAKE
jgi:hypothetical protein